MGDHRLLEDGGERRGALGSDAVVSETVRARGGVGMVRVGVSMGTDTNKRTLGGGGALERGHRASLERLAELGDALSGVLAVTISVEATELVGGQAVKVGVG